MWRPPFVGVLPKPIRFSDEGLARSLSKNWTQHGPDMNPIEIGLKIPSRIQTKAKEISNNVSEMLNTEDQNQKKSKKKKTKNP
jgi:hypothetical protein